jgi:hypothetical protein
MTRLAQFSLISLILSIALLLGNVNALPTPVQNNDLAALKRQAASLTRPVTVTATSIANGYV